MKKIVYFIVRYSILTKGAGYGIAKKLSYDKYKKELFDPKRLDVHENFFKNLCLPSLKSSLTKPADNDIEYRLLIFTSTVLPEPYVKSLQSILQGTPHTQVIFLEPDNMKMGNEVDKIIREDMKHENDAVCVTVRIDDDDALSQDFPEQIKPYCNQNLAGFPLTWGLGYSMVIDKHFKKSKFYELYYPKVSAGLTYINVWNSNKMDWKSDKYNVFSIGAHTKVDKKMPTIVDARLPTFIKTFHLKSDGGIISGWRRLRYGRRRSIQKISSDDVRKRFQIDSFL